MCGRVRLRLGGEGDRVEIVVGKLRVGLEGLCGGDASLPGLRYGCWANCDSAVPPRYNSARWRRDSNFLKLNR